MKINRSINTTIITENSNELMKLFNNEIIIDNIEDLKNINAKFVVFFDVIRLLKEKDKIILLNKLEKSNIHFINITSSLEESLFTEMLIVIEKSIIVMEGPTLSVLKEEKILKRLGYKLPFIVDLSLQLNSYGLINSIFLDNETLVNRLW